MQFTLLQLLEQAYINFKESEAHILYSWSHRDDALQFYWMGYAFLTVDIFAYNCVFHNWPHDELAEADRQRIRDIDVLRKNVWNLILDSYEKEQQELGE